MPRQRLEGCSADELAARLGEHDIDLRAGLDQQARQFRRLVGRYAAGDAQYDAFACEFAHMTDRMPGIRNDGFYYLMEITDWPDDQRPRERLLELGPGALADAELLAIFLRVGVRGKSAVDLARSLLAHFDNSLARLAAAAPKELIAINGIGPAKAAQLVATLELARRGLREELRARPTLGAPDAVRDWLRLRLAPLPHEVFVVLWLDAQNHLIVDEELFRGTLTQTSVYPREVVKQALARNAAAVILAHNHPSGSAEPSAADRLLTAALKNALALVDVRVVDHFVVAGNARPLSFAEQGLL